MKLRSAFTGLLREGGAILLRKLIELLLYAIGAFIGAWLLSILASFFQVSGQPTWSAVLFAIARSAREFVQSPFQYSIDALRNNLSFSILFMALLAMNFALIIVLRRSNRRLRSASIERALAIRAGIGGRWPHALINKPEGAPWDELCKEIHRGDNHHLYILGANGIETFGASTSPLFDVMQDFRGEVRVVLLDPNSRELDGRAQALDVDVAEYRRAIRTSERRLRDLRRQHHAIEGRFYDGQPNWKLIVTSTTAWVQYYAPGGQHVNETPVWRFDVTVDGDGMYHLFRMEFDRIWRRCGGNEMNLN